MACDIYELIEHVSIIIDTLSLSSSNVDNRLASYQINQMFALAGSIFRRFARPLSGRNGWVMYLLIPSPSIFIAFWLS